MDRPRPEFPKRLKQALASPVVGVALERALGAFRQRRDAAFQYLDLNALRDDLAMRKGEAIEQLPLLIEQFQLEAEKVGAVVHHAPTAEDARQVVGKLLSDRGAKVVVKSKSMATEEIALNSFLESLGVQVVETDLGEWIVQLAGDHPSHLIAPAIHKTREEIAELFRRKLGVDVSDDTAEMVKIAREYLRESFIRADAGISGANIAIAESGSIVIVSNEGNARLVTTLPPLHIAVVGIEKIVRDLDDATAILKVLARSAVGQKMSSYVSFITGPSRTADIELKLALGVHGPAEVHIVLLDNGRSALRADEERSVVLRCIRCAACANVCPSYQVVGGHAFGHVYTGPIGLLLTEAFHGLDKAVGPQSLCTSCNACASVCPVNIPIPELILGLRRRAVRQKGLIATKRFLLAGMSQPAAFQRWTGLARFVQRPFVRNGFVRAPLMDVISKGLPIPALAAKPLRDRLQQPAFRPHSSESPVPGGHTLAVHVGYFAGCITDQIHPEVGEAVVKVLRGLGADVTLVAGHSCCGLPAINSGDHEAAVQMAKQTIKAMERVQGDEVVSGSTSCVATIKLDYPRLFKDDSRWRDRALAQRRRIVDFASYLVQHRGLWLGPTGEGTAAVTYHDSCQSANRLHLMGKARTVVQEMLGLHLVEMEDSSACCGFGGSFSIEHPELAKRIASQKIARIQATGVSVVIADNPGCIMHLRGALEMARVPVKVLHLAELVAEKMGTRDV